MPDGRYVPLSEQDPRQWLLPLIKEAERHLSEAFKQGRSGRFQLEAAIQSVHAERARSGRTDWTAITLFYEQLVRGLCRRADGVGCEAVSQERRERSSAELKGKD